MSWSRGAVTWTDLWAECTERLGNSDEARQMIEAASGRTGASWLITLESQAPTGAAEKVGEMIKRRLGGEPLQYVLGRWGFRHLSLRVDRRVLIPRPETEQVVEFALQAIRSSSNPLVVDLGTGSGAIALSIASEHESALVYAIDASTDALDVAETNLNGLSTDAEERVLLLHGSWFEPLPGEARGKFDLVVSNPPYIGEREAIEPTVRDWEPAGALFSGSDGLDAIKTIVSQAPQWLKANGTLVVEIAPQQSDSARQLAAEAGFGSISVGRDLAQRERCLIARKTA